MHRARNQRRCALLRGIEASAPQLREILIRCLVIAALGSGASLAVGGMGIASDQPPAQASPATKPGSPSPTQVYRSACLNCHDCDGRGEAARDSFPTIPDFTNPGWHASRADEDLGRAIIHGKGRAMSPMKKKLGTLDVTQMVSFVRAFRGGGLVVQEEAEETSSAKEATAAGPSKPAEAPPKPDPAVPSPTELARSGSGTSSPGTRPSALATAPARSDRSHAASALFRRHCVSCHGQDGRGSELRATFPSIPDFSARQWQVGRDNAQLTLGILEGKGASMPAWSGRISAEEARDLVAYVRAFGPPGLFAGMASESEFASKFRRLQERWEELDRQVKALPRP
jgi:mono/diheme cytochrome c family protein